MNLPEYFEPFRKNIIGIDATFQTPYGEKPVIYADWTASGRLYAPIEQKLAYQFGELVGNTHSESTITGTAMTYAYHIAKDMIKEHVNASKDDVFLAIGSGMTGAVNKLQRILGLRIHEKYRKQVTLSEPQRPVVFITHLEHHSNQTSWLETIADVVVLDPDADGLVDLQNLEENLEKYKNRPLKIGAFSSCSNVSGIYTPYHQMAKLMHRYNGWCFVDFAASAPYIDINMHPEDPEERLDAIYFSPHKFLGGPGSSGVLIFNSALYQNRIPDNVGGGIVNWTNPWGGYSFVDDIENREDAGTPAFLQTIRSALCVELKDRMQVENIHHREADLLKIAFAELRKIQNLRILAGNIEDRQGIISFYLEGIHYNLVVKILNDYYGIQARGGCSCAGTYGHYLLHVNPLHSKRITDKIDSGDNSEKPGWIRISFHPTTTDAEVLLITDAIAEIASNVGFWQDKYQYSNKTNEFYHQNHDFMKEKDMVKSWFSL
ncbi:MAG: aminotransferase class V-fold PLP-dependent enzyme [Spirosomataceae bacterium]